MKNLYKFLFLSATLVLAANCGNRNTSDNATSEEIVEIFPITIDTDTDYPKSTIKLDQIADISFVTFKTPAKMFYEISGTPVYILDDGYVIKSFKNQELWRFDSNGRFMNKIGRPGRGPGEIINMLDFFLDSLQDGSMRAYLHDGHQHKVLTFDLDGKCLNEWRYSGVIYNRFEVLNDSSLIAIRNIKPYSDREAEPAYLFAAVSKKDGSLIKQFGPFSDNNYEPRLHIISSQYFHKDGDGMVIMHDGCDTIFNVQNSYTLSPRYIFTPALKDADTDIERTNKFIQILTDKFESIHCSKLTDFSEKGINVKQYNIHVDKQTGEISEAEYILDSITVNPMKLNSFCPVPFHKNTVCTWLEPSDLQEALEEGKIVNPQLKAIAENLDENSNPILMVLKFL